MIRKGKFLFDGTKAVSIADQFSTLAGMVRSAWAAQAGLGEIPLFDQQRDRTLAACKPLLDGMADALSMNDRQYEPVMFEESVGKPSTVSVQSPRSACDCD